jgi:hypothetical protein
MTVRGTVYVMHSELKKKVRTLRLSGKSVREIERELNVARSNVSLWVRDIILSEEQLKDLAGRSHSLITIERRRTSRLKNESARRAPFLREGIEEIKQTQSIDLMMLALGIYMGEGAKTSRGTIALSNTDPRIIQIFVKFLLEKFRILPRQLRAQVGLHSHLSASQAEAYWSSVSGIPKKSFVKTVIQHNRKSKGERDKLPYGTLTIYLHDTKRRIMLEGWIQGVYQRLFPKNTELHSITKLRI